MRILQNWLPCLYAHSDCCFRSLIPPPPSSGKQSRTSSSSPSTTCATGSTTWATSRSRRRISIGSRSAGVTFTHAYCASPVCNPVADGPACPASGQAPPASIATASTGGRSSRCRRLTSTSASNGYYVCGAGKIYHGSYPRDKDWDDYQHETRPIPTMSIGSQGQRQKEAKATPAATPPTTASAASSSSRSTADDEDMVDYHTVNYALKQLNKSHDKPLFVACGLHKPHMAVGRAEEVLRHVPARQDPAAEGAGNRPRRHSARRRRDGQARRATTPTSSTPAAGRKPCKATWPPSPSATR